MIVEMEEMMIIIKKMNYFIIIANHYFDEGNAFV